MFVKKQTFETY